MRTHAVVRPASAIAMNMRFTQNTDMCVSHRPDTTEGSGAPLCT